MNALALRTSSIIALTGAALAAPAQFYHVVDLSASSGWSDVHAMGVNDSGQVTGYGYNPAGDRRAFLSAPGGGALKDLGTVSGAIQTAGLAVNSSGQVAGSDGPALAGANENAFLSDANGGTLHNVAPFPDKVQGGAYAVNDAGQATGSAIINGMSTQAFLTNTSGGFRRLGTIIGYNYSYGLGVNASGQVAGYAKDRYSIKGDVAFISAANGGELRPLGTLGGDASYATGLNDLGQVAGYSTTTRFGYRHAFLSAPDGGALLDLGTLGGLGSQSKAVNAAGQVVGFSDRAAGAGGAFLYDAVHGMRDLNLMLDSSGAGWGLSVANSISNSGYIVGDGSLNGVSHSFLLMPVPEPAPFAGLALVALAVLRRRGGRPTPR